MFKKIFTGILIMIMAFSTLSNCVELTFKDVENHWAKKEIYKMAEKWIILGRGDGTFGPNENITKSHAFLMFARLMGYYNKENADIIKQGNEEYSDMLRQAGITQAIDELCFLIKSEVISEDYIVDVLGNGMENNPLTRVEASVVFVKLLGDEENLNKKPVLIYNDVSLIKEEYRAYVEYVNSIGLMVGFEDNTFNPNGYVTRAQVATILYRIDNIIYERGTSKQIGIIDDIDFENLELTLNVNDVNSKYKFKKNVQVYKDDELTERLNLKINDKVTAYFEDDVIVRLVINNTQKNVYAKFESLTDDGYMCVKVNNSVVKYKIASNIVVNKNDNVTTVNNINNNEDIKLTILNDRIIEISIGEVSYTVSGIIEEITIGKKSYITIRNINDEVKKYEVSQDMICDYDGVETGIYDLRLDMEVKMNITDKGIKKIIIETITNIEIIEGTVEKVLPNIYVFTVKQENDNVMMIFLDEEETIIKTSLGIFKSINDIKEKDTVSVYGRYEGEVFYPIQVIIQK